MSTSPSLTGYSPNNPRSYLGPNVGIPIIVTRNREPTGADIKQPETGKYYSFGTLWLVGKNPSTGTWGDLWYLAYIQNNVAIWEQAAGTGGYPISPYVVGPAGQAGYQTIQSAIDAASASGGGTIYIQPGSYTENLTLAADIELVGSVAEVDAGNIVITGIHTPPSSGTVAFRNISLASATHVFSSTAAGTGGITINECIFQVTNGFSFNLPNWVGSIRVNNCDATGTNDGFINNSGGCTVFTNNSQLGAGTSNVMIANGILRFDITLFACPVTLSGSHFLNQLNICFFTEAVSLGGSAFYSISTGCEFFAPITLTGSCTGSVNGCLFSAGASAAITMSSSGAISITNSTVTSSNNPAIAGSGAGALTLGNITFTSNAVIAGTLTVTYSSLEIASTVVNVGGVMVTSGTGVPSASLPKGSLYMRKDGSGVNDRAYIATDAVGTWTAIVTVA